MLKKATLFLSLVVCLFSTSIYAQNPTDKIVFSTFNQAYFKETLISKLNYIRDTLKVPELVVDDFLEQPADHHAKYLAKTSQVTNIQEGKYPNVEDRVNYFKGNYGTLGQLSAAANVGKTTFLKKENKKVTYETYEEVADGIIKDIFNYSSNKKYIDNVNFSNVGLALAIDEAGKRIYAVFVLSNKPYLAPYGVKIPENAYGIKPEDSEKCAGAKSILKKMPATVQYGAYIENGELFFFMNNLDSFDKLFEEAIDAIAIDLIHKDQFSCEGTNIQHKSPIHDGILLPLVKKKSIIKNNKKASESQVLSSLGKVPAQIKADDYEANVIFTKSKCMCGYARPMPFTPDSLTMLHMGLYVDTINPDNEVYLDQNPTKIKYSFSAKDVNNLTEEADKLINYLGKGRLFDFKRIDFVSYYPINANADSSITICNSIANTLVYKVQQNQADTIKSSNYVAPRWVDFYKTINGTKHETLKYLSRDEINKKITTTPDLAKRLDSTVFKKPYKFDLTIELQIERLKFNQPFDVLKTKIDDAANKGNKDDVNTLLKAVFNEIHHKVIAKEDILKLEIPRKPEFIEALISVESFKYLYGINNATYSYDEFVRLNALSPGNKRILYNMAVLNIMKSFDNKDKLKSFDPIYSDIQNLGPYDLNKKLTHKLNANYYFLKAYKEHKNNQSKRREEAMKSANSYCVGEELSDQNLAIAINNYGYYSENEFIAPLVEKIVTQDNTDKDVLLDFIKFTMDRTSEINATTYNLALENAYTLAPKETCELFSTQEGSFQIKNSKILKDFYCRHCNK